MNPFLKQTLVLVFVFGLAIELSSQIDSKEFNAEWQIFLDKNWKDGFIKYNAINQSSLEKLQTILNQTKTDWKDPIIDKATGLNVYNFLVIKQVILNNTPVSVQDIPGFFTRKNSNIGNQSISLNEFEKVLFKIHQDPRMHFALICGAKGCPKMNENAFQKATLENQLNEQTKKALMDRSNLYTENKKIYLSKIFKWYKDDFGGNKQERIDFIITYTDHKFDKNASFSYLPYDWSLNNSNISTSIQNSTSTNQFRYIVSSTIAKGTYEFKLFNNLYSQNINDVRSNYFTSIISALYGLDHRINVGFQSRFRMTTEHFGSSSHFGVFNASPSKRSGMTGIGPMIRYAPVPKWKNFSIQSSFILPIGSELEGNDELLFIDWQGPIWNTQFFNDFSIAEKFSLFTEIDLFIEDIGKSSQGYSNRFSTPLTLIFSYVPTKKISTYLLSGYSPYWGKPFDYFVQLGAGVKYQFTPQIEIEFLSTWFDNKFLAKNNGDASTINLGLRINQ